jgi:hypothetical protein
MAEEQSAKRSKLLALAATYSMLSSALVAVMLYLLFGPLGHVMDELTDVACRRNRLHGECLSFEQGQQWYRGHR